MQGVLAPDDARRAVEAGVDGIIVSNHGGRQVGLGGGRRREPALRAHCRAGALGPPAAAPLMAPGPATGGGLRRPGNLSTQSPHHPRCRRAVLCRARRLAAQLRARSGGHAAVDRRGGGRPRAAAGRRRRVAGHGWVGSYGWVGDGRAGWPAGRRDAVHGGSSELRSLAVRHHDTPPLHHSAPALRAQT